jgi:magnesium-transporting ATPase (P-type)
MALDTPTGNTTTQQTAVPLYALQPEDVYGRLGSSPQGLSREEAKKRLQQYGPNEVKEVRGTPLILKFLSNFYHFFALLLWAAAILAFIGGLPELGYAIILVIIVNGVFSFYQEYKAEKATEALKRLLPAMQTVVRDGEDQRVIASELVPGDVILLAEGDAISADARLVESFELRTNNSTLTGEALPVPKTSDPIVEENVTTIEVPNYVFASTSVSTGTGRAVIIATGAKTEFGKIANLTQTVKAAPSPLEVELNRVVRIVAILAVSLGVIFFGLGVLVGLPPVEGFLFAVGIIVANVPEGLLPTVTLALAVGVQRMARRQALVKKLSSVETLGSTNVIVTDKTGTLTANEMTVRKIATSNEEYNVTGVGYEPKGNVVDGNREVNLREQPALFDTIRAASAANNARVLAPAEDRPGWSVVGDPTEAALLVAASKAGFDYYEDLIDRPRIFELPFDSVRKRMSSINREDGHSVAYVKGAPNEILAASTKVETSTGVQNLTPDLRQKLTAENDQLAREGLRVLAMARRELPEESRDGGYSVDKVEHDLTFLGLMAMQDPPRPEVAEAVRTANDAGIRVVMVTGDYGLTAESIARKIGIVTTPEARIITGADLDKMTEKDLQKVINSGEVIFARVKPEDKMLIVSAFKDQGAVVAVTGDGVNDAPALKRADIGVAMGIAGTDVAKEASSMVLTNDNFASIVAAVEEGRAVYDNIKKFITYIFASNIPELLPFLAFVLLGIPLALNVLQILAIDLGTDLLPALALGTEKPEPGVMQRKPRSLKKPLLSLPVLLRAYGFLGVIEAIAAFTSFFWVYYTFGWRPGDALESSGPVYTLASSMAFAAVVFSQIGNGFATRTERASVISIGLFSNRLLLYGIALELVLLYLLTTIPFLQSIFRMTSLRPTDWLFLLIWPPFLLFAEEGRKYIVRRRGGAK